MSNTVVRLCSLQFANTFLSGFHWKNNWVDASDTDKQNVLVNATSVILNFCKFYDENEEEVIYSPETEDDIKIPDWLRQACCYEALYFFDLENDPARPFPLGILGIIKDNKTTFDHDYEPPLFSIMARQMLEVNGAEVNDPYYYNNYWKQKKTIG